MADFQSTIELKAVTRDIDKKLQGVTKGLGRVEQRVRETTGQFKSLGAKGSKSMQSLGSASKKVEMRFEKLNNKMRALGTSLKITGVLFGSIIAAKALSSATQFEKKMGAVRATINGTAEEMKKLTTEARRLGKTTAFSAGEAADAMLKLSMAGFTADESFSATQDTLALAAAGSLDLAQAADIASNVLAGFSLNVGDLAHVTDVMAKAASKSNTSVGELGEALSYVGPIAEQSGQSIELTVAAIGKLSDAGIKSSRAGTNVRQVLLKLQKPTSMAQKTLDKLGIATRDSAGEFRGMVPILREFGAATSDAGDFARVFGIIASSGAGVLAKAVQSGTLEDLSTGLESSAGAAKKMARIKLDNLSGSIVKMTSAWDGLTQTILQGGVLNYIRKFVDSLTSSFSKAEKSVKYFKENFDEIFNMENILNKASKMVSSALTDIGFAFAKFYIMGPVKTWKKFWDFAFTNPIEKTATYIKGTLSKKFEAIWESIMPGEILIFKMRLVGKLMKYVVQDWADSLIDAAKDIYAGVVKQFQKLYMKLVGGSIVPDMVNEIKDLWDELVDDLPAKTAAMSASILYHFRSLASNLTTALRGIQSLAKEVFNSSFVTSGIEKALSAIESQRHVLDKVGQAASKVGAVSLPIAIILNFDAIKAGFSDIIDKTLKGDFVGALKVVAQGIDAYLGNAIRGLTKTFETLYNLLNSDLSVVIEQFPKTFEAMKSAVDSIVDSFGGLLGTLSGPIGGALATIFDTIQGVLGLLTGIDGDSLLGNLIAGFVTLKVAALAWAAGLGLVKRKLLGIAATAATGFTLKGGLIPESTFIIAKAKLKEFAAVAQFTFKKIKMSAGMPPSAVDRAVYGKAGPIGAIIKAKKTGSIIGRVLRGGAGKAAILGTGLMALMMFGGTANASDFGENMGQDISAGLESSMVDSGTTLMDKIFVATEIAAVIGIGVQTGLLSGFGTFVSGLFPGIAAAMGGILGGAVATGLVIALSGVGLAALLVVGIDHAAGEIRKAMTRNVWQPLTNNALDMWDTFQRTGMGVGEYLGAHLSDAFGKAMVSMGARAGSVISHTIDGIELRAKKLGIDSSKIGDSAKLPDIYKRSVHELGNGLKTVTIELDADMEKIWTKYANTTPSWLANFDIKEQTEAIQDLINKSVGAGIIQAEESSIFDNAVDAAEEIGEELTKAGSRIKFLEDGMKAGTVSARQFRTEISNMNADIRKAASGEGVTLPESFSVIPKAMQEITISQGHLNKLLRHEADIRENIDNALNSDDKISLQKELIGASRKITSQLIHQSSLLKSQFSQKLVGMKKEHDLQERLNLLTRERLEWQDPKKFLGAFLTAQEKMKSKQELLNEKFADAELLVQQWIDAGLVGIDQFESQVAKLTGETAKLDTAWQRIVKNAQSGAESTLQKLIREKREALELFDKSVAAGNLNNVGQRDQVAANFDSQISTEKKDEAAKVVKAAEKTALAALDTQIQKLNLAATAAGDTVKGLRLTFKSSLSGLDKTFRDTFGKGWKENEEALALHQQTIATMTTAHNKALIAKQQELTLKTGTAMEGMQVGMQKFFEKSKTTAELFANAAEQTLGNIKSAVGGILRGDVDVRSALVGMVQPFLDAMIDDGINKIFGDMLGLDDTKPTGASDDPLSVVMGGKGKSKDKSSIPKIPGLDKIEGYYDKMQGLFDDNGDKELGLDDAWFAEQKSLYGHYFTELDAANQGFFGSMGETLSTGWTNLSETLSTAWDGLSGIFDNAFSGLSDLFSGGGGGGGGGIFGGLFGGLGDSLGGLFGGGDSTGGFNSLTSGDGPTQIPLGFAEGGVVPEPGNPEAGPTDTVPAMLTPGEVVLPTGIEDAGDIASGGDTGGGEEGGMGGALGGAIGGIGKAASGVIGKALGGVGGAATDATGAAALSAAAAALQAAATALTTSATGLTTAGTGLTTAGTGLTTAGTSMGTALSTASTTMSTTMTTASTTMSTALTTASTTMSAMITTAGATLTTAGAALTAAAMALKAAAAASAFADGGMVRGPGSGTSDSITARLSDGEYVINAKATKKFAPLLAAINSGKMGGMEKLEDKQEDLPTFAVGGMVGKGGTAHGDSVTGGSTSNPSPIVGGAGDMKAAPVYNTTHINISGNVDQRSIDQIRQVISSSPKQVNGAAQQGTRNESGIRQPGRGS